MAQKRITATVTNGSANVVVTGENLSSSVLAGQLFGVVGESALYTVAASPVFSAGASTVALTAPYAGTTGSKRSLIVSDYTAVERLPLLNQGDVNTSAVFNEAMRRIEVILSGGDPGEVDPGFLQASDNLSDLTDAAAARANLGLGTAATTTPAAILSGLTAANVISALGVVPWTSLNDGVSSGLDADLLDGHESTYFLNAGNLNAGVVAPARLGTGTPTSSMVLWGDGAWRAAPSGGGGGAGLGYTPVNIAGDIMTGDLAFASGVKLVSADVFGVKWQLKGANATVGITESTTSWDFSHVGLSGWKFNSGGATNFGIDATGIAIAQHIKLKAPTQGSLEQRDGNGLQSFRIYSLDQNNGADTESLYLSSGPSGASVVATSTGAGTPRPLLVGTLGQADLNFISHNALRWTIGGDGHLVPTSNVLDIGSNEEPVRDLHIGRRLALSPTADPVLTLSSDLTTGIGFPEADAVAIFIEGTEAVRIDAEGMLIPEMAQFRWSALRLLYENDALGPALVLDSAEGGSVPAQLLSYQKHLPLNGYVRAYMRWGDVGVELGTEIHNPGGGVVADPELRLATKALDLRIGGSDTWRLDATSFVPSLDIVQSIGTLSSRIKDVFVGGEAHISRDLFVDAERVAAFDTMHPDVGMLNPLTMALRVGTKLYTDEDFSVGLNNVSAYSSTATINVLITRGADVGAPNGSGQSLTVSQLFEYPAGVQTLDGFLHPITARANATFVQQFVALLPIGFHFAPRAVNLGSEGYSYWASNTAGTNKWETYTLVWRYGSNGTLDDCGGIVVVADTGTTPTSTNWGISSATVFDVTSRSNAVSLTMGGTGEVTRQAGLNALADSAHADPLQVLMCSPDGDVVWANLEANGALPLTGGTLTGNLNFDGAARRVTGNFSGAVAQRTLFQNSAVNGATGVGVVPNGTGNYASWQVFESATDPDNGAYLEFTLSAGAAYINTGKLGTGTARPFLFMFDGAEKFRLVSDQVESRVPFTVSSANDYTNAALAKLNMGAVAGTAGIDSTKMGTGVTRDFVVSMDGTEKIRVGATNALKTSGPTLLSVGNAAILHSNIPSGYPKLQGQLISNPAIPLDIYMNPDGGFVFSKVIDVGGRVIDVRAYGVIANTVSTTQMQAAINAASGGGTVYIPSGNWIFGQVTVPSGVTIVGNFGGTILSPPSGTVNQFVVAGNNVNIGEFRCDGTNLTGALIYIDSAAAALQRITIDHILLSAGYQFLIDNASASNAIVSLFVRNVQCLAHRAAGVKLRKAAAFIYFTDVLVDYVGTTPNAAGFDMSGNAGCLFTRCVVEGGAGTGTRTGAHGFLIDACQAVWFTDCMADTLDAAGFKFTGANQYIYLNNTVSSLCMDHGFSFAGAANVRISSCFSQGRVGLGTTLASKDGFNFSSACSNVSLSGCHASLNTRDGLNSNATANLVCNGGQYFSNSGRGVVTAGVGKHLFVGISMNGNSTGNYSIAGTSDHIRSSQLFSGAMADTVNGSASG